MGNFFFIFLFHCGISIHWTINSTPPEPLSPASFHLTKKNPSKVKECQSMFRHTHFSHNNWSWLIPNGIKLYRPKISTCHHKPYIYIYIYKLYSNSILLGPSILYETTSMTRFHVRISELVRFSFPTCILHILEIKVALSQIILKYYVLLNFFFQKW